MNITTALVYTPEAQALLDKHPSPFGRWSTTDVFGWPPVAGDRVTFGASEEAPIFEVRNRTFIWISPDELVVQLLLAPAE